VATLLTGVREAILSAIAHADMPTNRILRVWHASPAPSMTSVMFDFRGGFEPLTRLGVDGPRAELLDLGPAGAKFALNLSWVEYGDELSASLEYATSHLDEHTVSSWLEEYRAVLRRLATVDPRSSLLALFGDEDSGDHESAVSTPTFRF
jgi:non-ribosomal peptide synthetase component F